MIRSELAWTVRQVWAEKGKIHSERSPQEISEALDRLIVHRDRRSSLMSRERFQDYMRDFEAHGDEAFARRGMWGKTNGQSFEYAAASGYRGHRYWVPVLSGIVGSERSSLQTTWITYKLRSIPIRHFFILFAILLMIVVLLVVGIALLATSQISGIATLAVSCILAIGLLIFVHACAPIAIAMKKYLKNSLEQLVRE